MLVQDLVEKRRVVFHHQVTHTIVVDVEIKYMQHLVKLLRLHNMTSKIFIDARKLLQPLLIVDDTDLLLQKAD